MSSLPPIPLTAPLTVEWQEQVDSTNSWAWRHWREASSEAPALFLANTQTQGRGTQGRTWVSPPGAGLYMSVLYPASSLSGSPIQGLDTGWFTTVAGRICQATLDKAFGPSCVTIRPPNDLYAVHPQTHTPGKLGGILTETRVASDGTLRAVVTGIGLNWQEMPRLLDERAQAPAISLETLFGSEHLSLADRQAFALDLALSLGLAYQQALGGLVQ